MSRAEESSILEEWFTDVSSDFMRHGNCNGMDVNLFFPYKGESVRQALQACNGAPATHTSPAKPECPVKAQCLEYAMSLPNLCVGVWGGTSQKHRRYLRSEQQKERQNIDVRQVAFEHDIDPNLAELVRLVSEVNRGGSCKTA